MRHWRDSLGRDVCRAAARGCESAEPIPGTFRRGCLDYFPIYGDIAGLDADHDGIQCGSLPGAP
jgi:hypothetical protein